MNRTKKEEIKKYNEARKGKLPEEIARLNLMEEYGEEIETLTRKLHSEKFPEEYDFMYDELSDMRMRKAGRNPMSREYIERIRIKRMNLGVSQLSESGMAVSDDTMQLCRREAEKIISDYIASDKFSVPDGEVNSQYIEYLVKKYRGKI